LKGVLGFSTDLEQFGHAESKNDIHFSGSGHVFMLTQFLKNIRKSAVRNWMITHHFYFLTDFFQINVAKIDKLVIMIIPNSFIA